MSVLLSKKNGIHFITIDRPSALNALNEDIMNGLEEAFLRSSWVPGEDVGIILTGAGSKAFVAGADISEFVGKSSAEASAMSRRGQEIFQAIEDCPIPVIAAVNGFALGGGCELAMACHIRLASENAMFGLPEVKLGLIPGYGGTQRLCKIVGSGKALELSLTGNMLNAQDALNCGLVQQVLPQDELLEAASSLLIKIGRNAPLSVQKILKAERTSEVDPSSGMSVEEELFGSCFETQDAKEGVAAFLEKRRPDFTGK